MPSWSTRGVAWVVFAAAALGACSTAAVPARAPSPASSPGSSASTPLAAAPLPSAPLASAPLPAPLSVEDHTVPPSDAHVTVVRETMRQKLTELGVCSRPYRLRVDVTLDQVGAGPLRARLRAVVYRKAGEVAGDIPTTLSAEHAAPEDRTSSEADLLRSGADRMAKVFSDNFR
jgi:hypothetical protein